MYIPTPLIDLGKTHATLRHSPRQQTVVGKATLLSGFFSIQSPGAGRFIAKISQFRQRSLHPKRQLILTNPGIGLWVADLLKSYLVDSVDGVNHFTPNIAAHPRRVVQIEDRGAVRTKRDARIFAGKKTATPQLRRNWLQICARQRQ